MPILIAIGICTMLAGLSLSSQFAAQLSQRTQVMRLDRMEGFYVGELLAWHGYQRGLEGLPKTGSVTLIPANPSELPPEPLSNSPGVPFHLGTTSSLAPANQFIRRIPAEGLRYTTTSDCGLFSTKLNRLRICLSTKAASSGAIAIFVVLAKNAVSNASVFALDKKGAPVSSFGTEGRYAFGSNVEFGTRPGFYWGSSPIGLNEWGLIGALLSPTGTVQGAGIWGFTHEGKASPAVGSDGHIDWPAQGPCSARDILIPNSNGFVTCDMQGDVPRWIRINRSGALDSTFGTNGSLRLQDGVDEITFHKVLRRSDGKLLAAGKFREESGDREYLALFDSNGNLDSSFGTGGRVVMATLNLAAGPTHMALDANDNAFVTFTPLESAWNVPGSLKGFLVSRSGSVDPAYVGGVSFPVEVNLSCVIDKQFRLTCRSQPQASQTTWEFRRYLPNGSLDTTYGTGGTERAEFPPICLYTNMSLATDGGIWWGCSYADGVRIARIGPQGKFDSSLGNSGIVTVIPKPTGLGPLVFDTGW